MKSLLTMLALTVFLLGCGEAGSESGAGGAGPGYDGSSQGTGNVGTVPEPGSGVGTGWNNSATNSATNSGSATNR